MRIRRTQYGTTVWLSARDTEAWATRPGKTWPCSTIAGHALRLDFDAAGNLCDFHMDERHGDCDAAELSAILEDVLGTAHPITH